MRFFLAVAGGVRKGFSSASVISKYKLGSSAASVSTKNPARERTHLYRARPGPSERPGLGPVAQALGRRSCTSRTDSPSPRWPLLSKSSVYSLKQKWYGPGEQVDPAIKGRRHLQVVVPREVVRMFCETPGIRRCPILQIALREIDLTAFSHREQSRNGSRGLIAAE